MKRESEGMMISREEEPEQGVTVAVFIWYWNSMNEF